MTQITADRAQQSALWVMVRNPYEDQTHVSDHLYGTGSKEKRIYANNLVANQYGDKNLIQVQSSWEPTQYGHDDEFTKTALIENLIIDGQGETGVTGITLENVYHSMIRNITIKNCDIGIKLHNRFGLWTECNCLKHIRMENVKTGIQFSTEGPETIGDTTNPGDSAAFTIIDDVGIELKNDANAVGIKVGADNSTHLIKPYSSYIKSNVWMKSAGGTGLKINNGELKHGTINLAVQGPTDGIGINLGSGNERVYKNQFTNLTKNPIEKGCLLSTGGIPIENRIIPTYPMPTNDIKVKAY